MNEGLFFLIIGKLIVEDEPYLLEIFKCLVLTVDELVSPRWANYHFTVYMVAHRTIMCRHM